MAGKLKRKREVRDMTRREKNVSPLQLLEIGGNGFKSVFNDVTREKKTRVQFSLPNLNKLVKFLLKEQSRKLVKIWEPRSGRTEARSSFRARRKNGHVRGVAFSTTF